MAQPHGLAWRFELHPHAGFGHALGQRLFRLDLIGPSKRVFQSHGGQYAGRCPKGRLHLLGHYDLFRDPLLAGRPFSGGSGQSGAGDLIDQRRRFAVRFLRYDSRALEGAGALSMLLASGNFLLYWKSWERRSLKIFLHDAELRYFLMMFVGVSAVVSFHLCTTASMTAGIICATAFSRSYPLSVPAALRRRPWRTGRNLISMSCFYWPLSAAVSGRPQGAQGHALYGAV